MCKESRKMIRLDQFLFRKNRELLNEESDFRSGFLCPLNCDVIEWDEVTKNLMHIRVISLVLKRFIKRENHQKRYNFLQRNSLCPMGVNIWAFWKESPEKMPEEILNRINTGSIIVFDGTFLKLDQSSDLVEGVSSDEQVYDGVACIYLSHRTDEIMFGFINNEHDKSGFWLVPDNQSESWTYTYERPVFSVVVSNKLLIV